MGFFYKKCEVCGNKIKKCNSIKEYIFGNVEVNCNNCQTKYKPRAGGLLSIIYFLYIWYVMPFINILFIVYALDNFIPISFGFEIWFIAIFLYYLSWRLLIGFWPLKNTKKDKK
jgi:hypothetical protein